MPHPVTSNFTHRFSLVAQKLCTVEVTAKQKCSAVESTHIFCKICIIPKIYNGVKLSKNSTLRVKIGRTCSATPGSLTWQAGDQRLLPLAAGQTLDDRVQFLREAVLAVVAHPGVGLVTRALLPEHSGVGHPGRLATGRCTETLCFSTKSTDTHRISAGILHFKELGRVKPL